MRLDSASVDAVFESVSSNGNLVLVKDNEGLAYLPDWNFNGIGNLFPGKAYQVKTNNEDVLHYFSNSESYWYLFYLSKNYIFDIDLSFRIMSRAKTTYINFLSTLFLLGFSRNVYSQCIIPPQYSGVVTGNNLVGMLPSSFIQSLNVTSDSAYIVVSNSDGLIVGSSCVSSSCLLDGQTTISIWGDDTQTPQIDGAEDGAVLNVQLVDGMHLQDLSVIYQFGSDLVFQTNGIVVFNSAVVESSCYFNINVGCIDSSACNYNSEATDDDGSCIYINNECDVCVNGVVVVNDEDGDNICDFDEIPGCQDTLACNYNPLATDPPIYFDSGVNPMECSYDDSDNDGICDLFEIPGCTDYLACNYDAYATDDDGSCSYAK